jgi:hypothetical protein
MFGDEAVDPCRDNGQRYRAELEHGITESADVEFETRSLPNLLVATLATLPSMSLIPSAPFAIARPASLLTSASLSDFHRKGRRGDLSPVLHRHHVVVANFDPISKAARLATTKHR